jgi:hypothetical protein
VGKWGVKRDGMKVEGRQSDYRTSCRGSGRTHAVSVEMFCSLPSEGNSDAANPFTAVILYGMFGSSSSSSFLLLPQSSSIPSPSSIILCDSFNFIP